MWKKELGKSLLNLANTFAAVLILGSLANVAFQEVTFSQSWWLLVLGLISTILLYVSGTANLKQAELTARLSAQPNELIYD